MTLVTDDAHRIYAFGRFDAHHRLAVVLNDSGATRTVTIPAYQLSMTNSSRVTDLLTGRSYQVSNGHLKIRVAARYGAILEQ